jgi:hypothetical protein
MPTKFLWRMAATLVLGCSSTPIEVGSSYIEEEEGQWGWTDERACSGGSQLPIVGTWIGFTDKHRAPSGSDVVRLVITHANARRVCGTLTIGREAPPWPAITDSNAPYPPDIAGTFQPFEDYLANLEGVPMTITSARVGLPNVRFKASYAQWKGWCSFQTPYPCEGVAMAEHYCVPASGSGGLFPRVNHEDDRCFSEYGGETIAIDCGKATLCVGGPCVCTAAQCLGPPIWGSQYELDFRGDSAVGNGLYLTRVR